MRKRERKEERFLKVFFFRPLDPAKRKETLNLSLSLTSAISTLAPSIVPMISEPFIANFMLPCFGVDEEARKNKEKTVSSDSSFSVGENSSSP